MCGRRHILSRLSQIGVEGDKLFKGEPSWLWGLDCPPDFTHIASKDSHFILSSLRGAGHPIREPILKDIIREECGLYPLGDDRLVEAGDGYPQQKRAVVATGGAVFAVVIVAVDYQLCQI